MASYNHIVRARDHTEKLPGGIIKPFGGCVVKLLKPSATAKDNNGKTLKPEYQVTREAYLAFERDWENKVDYSKLSEREKLIHLKHKEAIEDFHWTYIDPESGNKAITRFRHYLKK